MEQENMIRRNFYITCALDEGLKRLAKQTHISVSAHVRQALTEYLERQGRQVAEDTDRTDPGKPPGDDFDPPCFSGMSEAEE